MANINHEKDNRNNLIKEYEASRRERSTYVPRGIPRTNRLRYKKMFARFPGVCRACGSRIEEDTLIRFYGRNAATHEKCEWDGS